VSAVSGSATQLSTAIAGVDSALISAPTGVLSTDLATARSLLVTTPGATLQADAQALNTLVNGAATGSTVQARLGDPGSAGSINAMIGTDSAQSLTAALGNSGAGNSSISALLGGTSTTPLYGQIVGSSGLFSMIDGTVTDSGNLETKLGAQTQAVQNGATQLSTAISGVDSSLLTTPSGAVSTDLATARGLFVSSPGATMQADAETLNTFVNGTASGSTVQARLGNPTLNGTSSNLSALIGGGGADLASQIGDPGIGLQGVSGLIAAETASNSSIDPTAFRDATSLFDQLNAFVSLYANGATVPAGSYESLADLVNAMS
jgi:hypothetical protein